MITIAELNGYALKKALNCQRAKVRYHNKNKQGGNFGVDLISPFNKEGRHYFEINGEYNKDGYVYRLAFDEGTSALCNLPIWALSDFNTAIAWINEFQAWREGKGENPKVRETELLSKKEQLELIGFEFEVSR